MTDFTVHCPRCKQHLSGDDADRLADALLDHVQQEHGHAPPREHVLARIERQDPAD
jgi:predicted small metal-binding protein